MMPKDNGEKYKSNDPYNGDDGPGFDYEFHESLLHGVHLMNDEERLAWFSGWEAAKKFFGVKK